MFTGLIQEVGTIKTIKTNTEGKEFVIYAPKLIKDIKIDDSVATNGVCLTATKIEGDTFKVQAVHMTLKKTSIGQLSVGSPVNLELSLRPQDRLGGHMVSGHVNDLGVIKSIDKKGQNWEITVGFSAELRKYMIQEGSVALDGISLTIAELKDKELKVSIIPHTLENTNLGTKKIGDVINIEVDMVAKYIENFILLDPAKKEEWARNYFNAKFED
ncbi:MAG TPA: riboflavin synthase [Bacteriovoracaceae bacterium]|nr:riboflavin synthase [Bacteriovoracaceae bacterium]